MADEVKFIHDALGESTIKNMATEATLKELLDAIGGSSNRTNKNSLASLTPTFGGLQRKVRAFEQGVKSAMRPFTGFVSLIGKGEVRMSVLGNHLNDSLISKLPVVGGLFGSVGSVVFTSVGVLETWNNESKKLATTGATFGNSLLEFVRISGETRLSMADLNAIVSQNVVKFNSIGPTTTQGIRNFSKFSKDFYDLHSNATTRLINMGYGFKDINENMVDFLFYTQRTTNMTLNTNVSVQMSFMNYMKNLDSLTKVFGMSRSKVNEASAKILKDSMMMIDMNRKDSLTQNKTAMAAQTLSAIYGEGVSDIYKSIQFGGGVLAGQGLELTKMLGSTVTPLVEQLVKSANDPNVSPAQFESQMDNIIATALFNSKGQLDSFQNLLAAMSVAPDMHSDMYNSINQIADLISRKDMRNVKTKEDMLALIREAKDEQKQIDNLTEIIRAFEQAMTNFSSGFKAGFTGPQGLLGLVNAMDSPDGKSSIDRIFNDLGKQIGETTERAGEAVVRLFKMMSTEDGRDYLKDVFMITVDKYSSKAKSAIQRGIIVMIREAIEALPGGSAVTGFFSSIDSNLKRIFGDNAGLGFVGTKTEYDLEQAGINLKAVSDRAALDTRRNRGFSNKKIPDGTVIYPDFDTLGLEKFTGWERGLVWHKNTWVPKIHLDRFNRQSGHTKRQAEDAIDAFTGGSRQLEGITGISSQRLMDLGQKSILDEPTTAVFFGDKGTVLANSKYAQQFQNLIYLLEGFGLNFTNIVSMNKGKAALKLSSGDGTSWFENLTSDEQLELIASMSNLGFVNYFDKTQVQELVNRLTRGELSAMAPLGPHADANEYRTGTLEATGRLFNDFGAKRQVAISGEKAVLTKDQYQNVMNSAAQIPIKDLIISVNSNVQEMIRLTKADIMTSKAMFNVA